MPMQITKTGLQAIANAGEGGFLLSITDFAVTEFPDVVLDAEDTALAGTPVYEGQADVIEVLDNATVKFTLTIPQGVPATGSLTCTEIGLYLDSGELFARGSISPAYKKTADISSSFHVLVTAAGCGAVINVDIGNYVSVPSVAFVKTLPRPLSVHQNTFAVLDENYNTDGSDSPSLAIKYGPGGAHWGFIGYDRVYSGPIGNVVSTGQFSLDPQLNGFWLEQGEQVIVQQLVGPGTGGGESRKFQYLGNGKFAIKDLEFSDLDETSHISVWKREIPANLIANTVPVPRSYTAMGDGQKKVFHLPFTPIDRQYVWTFVAGLWQRDTSFVLSGNQIQFLETIPPGVNVDFEGFELVEGGSGAVLMKYDFDFPIVNEITTRLTCQVTPKNKAYAMVFFDGIYQTRTDWNLDGADIVFNEPIPVYLTSVKVVVFEEQFWKNHSLSIESYSKLTQGFSMMQLNTPNSRPVDNPMMFMGSVFQGASEYNVVNNYLQFTGTVPGSVMLDCLDLFRKPPERLLALKTEVDQSIKDVFLAKPYVLRFMRGDDTYFDIGMAYNKGYGTGTLTCDKSVVSTTGQGTLYVYGGNSNGIIEFSSNDAAVAASLNSGSPTCDSNGNFSVTFTPNGDSRALIIKALVNGNYIGMVNLSIVKSSRDSTFLVNGSSGAVVTPDTTLIFAVRNAAPTTAMRLLDTEGNEIEIGYTDDTGSLDYTMKYDANQFGKSRRLSITASEIGSGTSGYTDVGTVVLTLVNNGTLFLVDGNVMAYSRKGQNLSFTITNALPNETITWKYTDDNGDQVIDIGVTDALGSWASVKTSDSFISSVRDTLDIQCEIATELVGIVTLHLLNNTTFLVNTHTADTITRNSRLTFELLNAEAGAPVYWVASDEPTQHNNVGKTNDTGYLMFEQTYGSDIGTDRTLTYTAYVNDVATEPVMLTVQNPMPVFNVNGLASSVIYPDSTLVFTITDAQPDSTIMLLASDTDLMVPIGRSDSLGDLTWSQSYSRGEIVDGKTVTITALANGIDIGSVSLLMKSNNAASLMVNGSKAAVVSYGQNITFALTNGDASMPIALTDTEGRTYVTGVIDTDGTFNFTKQYGYDIGQDRTITVYAQTENVILDEVQLIVLNNVGSTPRFRVDGQPSVQITDGTTAIFTITGAKPGAVATWSIPAWGISNLSLGNIDRNGNLAYVVEYNASMFRQASTVSIEAMVDNSFIGTVTIIYV